MLRQILTGFLIIVVGLLLAACQSTQAASAPTATVTATAPAATPLITPTSTPTLPPVVLTMTPTAEALGSINGWLWHDGCAVSGQPIGPGKQTTGCVQEGDHYRANGIKENTEAIIGGVKVKLGAGACPAIGFAEAETSVTDLSYSFTGLKPGTYCVSIDPLTEPSLSKLQTGMWTYPSLAGGPIGLTVNVGAGDNKVRCELWLGLHRSAIDHFDGVHVSRGVFGRCQFPR